ncbi:MAG: aminotransferase class V-fold PLP-dependent enzyme [Dehalococcoidia bacterium]|nr:aminotransferase class V-fold PLP-dependent enzyme [Dehalococcoidia bacterium]
MIYLDNAATSWPKPPEVARAMTDFLEKAGGNPGRSGHGLSVQAGRVLFETRELLAALFNAPDPLRVIFTASATHALNIALQGLLREGDHVVCSGIEHNSVMRPLRELERRGVRLTVAPCSSDGTLQVSELRKAVTPRTRLVALAHASNVIGTIQPVEEAAAIAHAAGALLLIDAAQTAGVLPIDIAAQGIDLLAFTGHKGLLGPQGTGGLVIGERVDVRELRPLFFGGTGSRSQHQEQPDALPDKYESGTPNGPGIAGLGAGVRFLLARGIDSVREHELALMRALIDGLGETPNVTLFGPTDVHRRVAIASVTVAGRSVSEVGQRLEQESGVLARVGLHCAPAAHRTIGTFPEGTVRLAPGVFTTMRDVDAAVKALRRIAQGR